MGNLPYNLVMFPRVSPRRIKLSSAVMHEIHTFWSTCKHEDVSKEVMHDRGISDIEYLQSRIIELEEQLKQQQRIK